MWQPYHAPSFLALTLAHANPLQEDSWLHPSLLSILRKLKQSVQWDKLLKKKAIFFPSCVIYGLDIPINNTIVTLMKSIFSTQNFEKRHFFQ
jgi:hypothetical protein